MHRELIRNLQHWRSLYEAMEAPDILMASDTRSYSLWDVQVFYEARTIVPDRMQQSIQFCLYENMKERDAAVRMGIAPSNPVSVYATIGLTTMLAKATSGELPGYAIEPHVEAPEPEPVLASNHRRACSRLLRNRWVSTDG